MNRALARRSISLRFALLARASTVALIAAAACAQDAFAKPPETHGATSNGGGGVGRNPNDLKDGVIDGNAGGQPPSTQQNLCLGGAGFLGLVNVINTTPMPLTGVIKCVTVNTAIDHDVVSEATVGAVGTGFSPFFVGTDGVIAGTLWNKGSITGGYASLTGSGIGTLTILGDVQDGVLNSGLITSLGNNGIQLGSSTDGVLLPGTIEGGITNDGTITALNDGIAMIAGSLSGGLANNEGALINGGNAAVYIADSFDSWSGGISNAGTLHGTDVGILIGGPGATNVEFAGGIYNAATGVISSGNGPAIFASGASYAGGLENWGLITETGDDFADVYGGTGVVLDALTVAGDIDNHGTIAGVHRQGLLITNNVGLFDGSIDNSGEINGAAGGVVVLAQVVNGNFVNSGNIGGGANTGVAYFNDTIEGIGGEGATAAFTNTGSIVGGTGLVIAAQTVRADFVNGDADTGAGTITGETSAGVILAAQSWTGNITNHGFVSGATVGMAVGYDPFFGKAPPGNTLTGSIVNNGSIHGDAAGMMIAIADFTGDFTNDGSITGGQYGVALEGGGNFQGSFFAASCIECVQPFSLGGGIFTGNVTNNDFMSGDTALFVSYDQFNGNLTNAATGTLAGVNHGLLLDVDDFQGNLSNHGTISAGGEGSDVAMQIGTGSTESGTVLSSQSFSGNISNTGSIHGQNTGLGVVLDNYTGGTGGLTNSGTITGDNWAGVSVRANQWTGDFTNASGGRIVGGITGVFINAGTISGDFTNNGAIVGSQYGVTLAGGTFTGDVTNTGSISGDTAFFVSHGQFVGNLTNTAAGTLVGTNHGLLLDVDDFQGNLSNHGTITAGGEGSGVALQIGTGSTEAGTVLSSQIFSGDISNTGSIHGQNTGLGVVLDTYTAGTGGLTNSGTIAGDNWTGVSIRANQWTGDFTNASGGRIVGGITGVYIGAAAIDGNFTNHGYIEGGVTGVFVNAGTISGDFTNDGTIVGNSFDTGWNISAASYTGNIVNGIGGLITAPSNALHLRIDAFSGQITNDGVIAAPSGNAVVIEGYNTTGVYSGAFTNTGTISASGIGIRLNGAQLSGGIVNDGGTIDGTTAISTYSATAATTITNTGGGIILGDLRLANNFADTFVAEDGGMVGQIIGAGANDDAVIVENGTHYFIGKASNLASFTVDDGGAAIMGATFEGDASGGGYSFANVGAINVNDGGTLYIDRSASLAAGTFTQQSGGALEFYLGAPGGANFANLTGTQAAVAGTDYGQIHLSGAANLDGSIAGFLDPAFASANPDLDAVVYNDVLIADGGVSGDFSTLALISNSSLFELTEVVEGNTVDLTVTRASLSQLGDIGTVVVETGGPWKSMVNDRSNGIGSGSCSLSGSGWCLNAYAANEAGGTTVMNDATPGADPFGWLRTGTRHEGETAFWGRVVGVWGDTSGDATHSATDFDTYGAIFGVDHAFTPIFLAGAAAQWTKSSIDFDGSSDNAHISSLEVGGYLSYGDARFYLNANTSVIFHSIDVTRFAPGGSAHGDYDGTTVSGYAEAGRIFETYDGFRIQPLAALSYAHLGTDAYNETGSATTLLHVFDANLDSLKSMLGARFAYPFALESGRKLVPETRIIWLHELLDDHSAFDANPLSNPLNIATVEGQVYNRDSLVLGAGMTAPLSSATTLFLDYDAALNENITSHTVSGGLRARW